MQQFDQPDERPSARPPTIRLYPGVGNRIRQAINRPSQDLVRQVGDYSPADIGDVLNRVYGIDPAIRCLTPERPRIVGVALTILTFPGDNLMVQKSISIAQPGDVLVINAKGLMANAVVGDMIARKAVHRGVAGIVIDGSARDVSGIREVGIPVFARGEATSGPLHRGPGEINFPVAIGGSVVNPGDVIVADTSGLVVIPRESLQQTLTLLERTRNETEVYARQVKEGKFSSSWVEEILETNGCEES